MRPTLYHARIALLVVGAAYYILLAATYYAWRPVDFVHLVTLAVAPFDYTAYTAGRFKVRIVPPLWIPLFCVSCLWLAEIYVLWFSIRGGSSCWPVDALFFICCWLLLFSVQRQCRLIMFGTAKAT